MWSEIAKQLGLFGIGAATLGWLTRSFIVHFLNKDVAKYRISLEHVRDVELERLRNDLRLQSIEHEIRFRSIHERQGKIIAGTYARLTRVYSDVSSFVKVFESSDEPSKSEKYALLRKSYADFRDYFYPRLIFLPGDSGRRVKDVGDQLAAIAGDFARGLRSEARAADSRRDDVERDEEDCWQKANEMLKEKIPPLLDQLQVDFQSLLGVTTVRATADGKA